MTLGEWFIPASVRQDADRLIKARTVVNVALLAAVLTPLFSISYFKLGHLAMGYGILAGGMAMALGALLLRLSGLVGLTAQFIIAVMFAMVSWMVFVNGGLMGTSVVWYASIPFTAVFVGGRRSGYLWAALTLLALVLFLLANGDPGTLPSTPIPEAEHPLLQMKSLAGLSIVVLVLALAFDGAKRKGFSQLELAREQAETERNNVSTMLDHITQSVHAASQESRDIAVTARLMVATMTQQSARTQEMVVTVQQMSALTEHNAEQSSQAAAVAIDARKQAHQGGDIMNNAMQHLDEAGTAMARSSEAIESLGRRSSEVNGIVQLIGEIADQTNMLALNAAIEAARAGDVGRGFAVVADEVRKLAERTQTATKDIETKIGLIVNGTQDALVAIREGVDRMQGGAGNSRAAHSSLRELIGGAQNLAEVLEQVAGAENSQSAGFKTFAGDIGNIGQSTQTLSNETAAIAEATRRLDGLMAELAERIHHFEQSRRQPVAMAA